MTDYERSAAILMDCLMNAIVRPSMYPPQALEILRGEVVERFEWLRDEGLEGDQAEQYILSSFITYLELLIEQRQPKEETA